MRATNLAYWAASVMTSGGALLPDDRVHAAAKYAIAPLAGLDVACAPGAWSSARRTPTLALLASLTGSALGDHLMLAESRSDGEAARRHLRRGAAAFGLQQAGFLALMARRGQRFRRGPSILATATLAALAVVDGVAAARSRDADVPTPAAPPGHSLTAAIPDPIVAGYGVLLTAMAALAQDDERTAFGGATFLIGDAVIVTRQVLPHGAARRVADALVMTTYTVGLKRLIDGLATH